MVLLQSSLSRLKTNREPEGSRSDAESGVRLIGDVETPGDRPGTTDRTGH